MTEPAVWQFERGADAIMLRCPDPLELVLSRPHHQPTRRVRFHTVADRVAFQSGFEAYLLDTGWSLAAFTPAAPQPMTRLSWIRRLMLRRRQTT